MINLITKTNTLLISLNDMKLYLRITNSIEDTLIENLIRQAQNVIENYTSRAITINTYEYIYDSLNTTEYYPVDRIQIYKGKITSIDSIKTYNLAGTETIKTLTDFDYINFNQYSYIATKDGSDFPIGDRSYSPLKIEFKAGYDITTIPYDLKEAIYKLVADYYEYRESTNSEYIKDISTGVINIINRWRIELIP